jgi:hypothetical protein
MVVPAVCAQETCHQASWMQPARIIICCVYV